jgi:hypothetical protein
VATATCTGTGATRACTAPITLVTNANHTLTVEAVGLLRKSTSVPFTIGPPNPAAGVGVR